MVYMCFLLLLLLFFLLQVIFRMFHFTLHLKKVLNKQMCDWNHDSIYVQIIFHPQY